MQHHPVHYTSSWISAIERGTTTTVEQLMQLLSLLPPQFAPMQPPPPNLFSADFHGPNYEIQVRYLLFHGECRIAEMIRVSAIHEARSNDWTSSAQSWSQAYNYLHRTQVAADPFFTLFVSSDENTELPDNHNYAQLQQLFAKLELVKEHTESERDRAIETMRRRLESIDRQLNPMQQDRDEVRSSIGEEQWTNNPRPKHDYARRRRPLEEERRALAEALEILDALSFSPGEAALHQPQ